MPSDKSFASDPRNEHARALDTAGGRKLIALLAVVCLVLLAADLTLHKHGPFAIEHLFGFYPLMGFAGSAALALVGLVVRAIVRRQEDYYDR